jgi:uncharacterized coiled-coil DUF342 family protein
MSNRELEFILSLKDKFSAEWQRVSAQVNASVAKMQAQFSQVKGWIAGAFSIGALRNFEQEFLIAEKSSAALAQALGKVGEAARIEEFKQVASDLQAITPFSDEAVQSVQQLLLTITKDADATKQLTPLVLDLATAMGVSVEQAAKMVARTSEGAKALQRMGIDIGKTSSEQERLAKLTQELETRLGGAAVAAGKTAAGLAEIRKNKFSDLQEDLGRIVNTGLEPFRQVLSIIVDVLKSAPAPIQTMVVAVGLLTAVFYALNISMGGIPLIVGGIITAMAGLASVFGSIGKSTQELKDELSGIQAEVQKTQGITTLATAYDALSQKTKLTALEHKQLEKTIQELATFMPSAVTAWNDEGRALGINTNAIRDNADARRALLLIKEKDFIKSEVIEPLTEAVAKYAEYTESIAKAQQTLSIARSDLVAAETGYAAVTRSVADLKNQINLSSSFLRDNSSAIDETKTEMTDLVNVLSLYVKNVKDFATVAPILKNMGVDATEIDLLKNKWNELTVVIGNVPQAIAEAGEAIKNAAGSLAAMREHLQELQKQFDATAPHTERWQKLNSEIKILESNLRALKAQAEALEDVQFDITVPDNFKLPKSLTDALDNAPNLKLQMDLTFATHGETSSINAQNALIAAKREELNAALTDADRARIDRELALEEGKLARMTGMGQQWLEQQRSLWAEQHQIAMIGISAIGAGVQTMWGEFVVGSRQAKDEWDAVWLSIRNTALNAIGSILAAGVEAYLIDSAAHAVNEETKTATTGTHSLARVAATVLEGIGKGVAWAAETAAFIAKEVAMTAVFLAQSAIRVAVILVEVAASIAKAVASMIASLGPFGLLGAAGIIALGAGVLGAIKGAFGFEKGGEFGPGQRGFIEGGQTEIIAPKRTFIEIMQTELIPKFIKQTQLITLQQLQPIISQSFVNTQGALRNFIPPQSVGLDRIVTEMRTIIASLPKERDRSPVLQSAQPVIQARSAESSFGGTAGGSDYQLADRLEKKFDALEATMTQLLNRLNKTVEQKPVGDVMVDGEKIVRDNLPKAQSVIAARMR